MLPVPTLYLPIRVCLCLVMYHYTVNVIMHGKNLQDQMVLDIILILYDSD